MAELNQETDNHDIISDSIQPEKTDKPNPQRGRLRKFVSLLKNKKVFIPVIALLVIAFAFIGLTDVKYSIAGLFMKKSVVVEIVDDKTLQPISGIAVELAGKKATTDGTGRATLDGVRTGKSSLTLSKTGYETKTQAIVVRFSTSKLEPVRIVGSGYPLSFVVKDKISGNPLKDAKITLAGTDSITNEKGEALVSVPPAGNVKLSLSTSKDGFNTITEEIEVAENTPTKEVALTPAGTVLFVSNKSKKYDVYAADLDGKNERVVLKATGKETTDTTVYPSPTGEYVALVAAREGKSLGYGNVQLDLYVITVASGELKKIDEQPTTVEWAGNTLVATVGGADEAHPMKVAAYNADTKNNKYLLDNTFGDYAVANEKIYYSLSDPNKPDYGLFSMALDGTGKKKLNGIPMGVSRNSVTTLTLIDYEADAYSKLDLTNGSIQKNATPESRYTSLRVVAAKNSGKVIYTRAIDKFPQLFVSNSDESDEKQLTKNTNVSSSYYITPNGSYVIFYGIIGTDAGVYILPIEGGAPFKIASGHVLAFSGPGQ